MAAVSVDVTGKVAVVTGAGSGLGAAMCRQFAAAGMAVAALDIDVETAATTAAELAQPRSVYRRCRADRRRRPAAPSPRPAAVRRRARGCDVLCANVGVQQFGAIDRLTDDDWTWVLDVNVLGTVRTVAAFLPADPPRPGWRQIVADRVVGRAVTGRAAGRLPDEQVRGARLR